ncbi:MAG: molybdopterin cofactor-binding domain-containing protein [Gammaproteobacteria bacterium]
MNISRRHLLLGSAGVVGGGLVLGWLKPDPQDRPLSDHQSGINPNAWLQIRPDGAIILQVDKIEMGQGVMTAYITLLAEELDVPPSRITPKMAPVHPLFQDPAQLTGESRSVASRWLPLRETGARARQMLLAAAAGQWQVDPATLQTDGGGMVVDASSRRASYAELADAAALLPVPDTVTLRQPEQFRWIGTSVPRPDVPPKVLGQASYGIDTRLPGMKVAVIRRPPRIQAAVRSYDVSKARGMPGVFEILPIHSGIAVVADGYWQARQQAAAAIGAEWELGPLSGVSTTSVKRERGAAARQSWAPCPQ